MRSLPQDRIARARLGTRSGAALPHPPGARHCHPFPPATQKGQSAARGSLMKPKTKRPLSGERGEETPEQGEPIELIEASEESTQPDAVPKRPAAPAAPRPSGRRRGAAPPPPRSSGRSPTAGERFAAELLSRPLPKKPPGQPR